ncbi:heat shock protein 70 family [Lipomyces oligophaga]|uniref:heat shock protein 70 family n=1 Tax=Lipomyces oligophaga TaxID=45792 RepID=UPI0034CDD8E1
MAEDTQANGVGEQATTTVIGLSFGNANSSISFSGKDGKVDIIANQDGDRSIPSMLSYVAGNEYHGLQAKAQLIRNPTNTAAYFRDFIGKPYAEIDPTYCHGSAHPVEENGVVGFKIITSAEEDAVAQFVSVAEITKRHFQRLIHSASDFLGKSVTGAVIAVPTDFTTSQRTELVKIAKEAGVQVMQVIQEPVAALLANDAVAYGAHPKDRIVVVADYGYSRSDAAVIAVRGGMYTILATAHNYELGGSTLDDVLASFFAKEFEKKNKIDPLKDSARSLAKLKMECEVTRKTLSSSTSSTISIESLAGGLDFYSTINRLRYETLARSALDSVVALATDVVAKAGLDTLDVDEILLVGGCSFTPKIEGRLEAAFPESTTIISPNSSAKALNSAELIARGAGVQASLIAGFEQSDIDESLQPVVTTVPHLDKTVGVVLADGSFSAMLMSHTALPIRKSKVFAAPTEGGNVVIGVWESESETVTSKVERTKPEPGEQDDEDEDEFSDDEDEDEEIRERVEKPTNKIAEITLKDVKPNAQIEVVINIAADLKVGLAVREIGGSAVKGEVEPAQVRK